MIVDDCEWNMIDESSERAGTQNLTRSCQGSILPVSVMIIAKLQGLRG